MHIEMRLSPGRVEEMRALEGNQEETGGAAEAGERASEEKEEDQAADEPGDGLSQENGAEEERSEGEEGRNATGLPAPQRAT